MSDRPYTEQQVFELEVATEDMARKLMAPDHRSWQTMGYETLEAILYDAFIALREAMYAEEDDD